MLKSTSRKTDFCSLDTLSRILFRQLALKSLRSIEVCLQIQPIIIVDFLGFKISIDSSSLLL